MSISWNDETKQQIMGYLHNYLNIYENNVKNYAENVSSYLKQVNKETVIPSILTMLEARLGHITYNNGTQKESLTEQWKAIYDEWAYSEISFSGITKSINQAEEAIESCRDFEQKIELEIENFEIKCPEVKVSYTSLHKLTKEEAEKLNSYFIEFINQVITECNNLIGEINNESDTNTMFCALTALLTKMTNKAEQEFKKWTDVDKEIATKK